jgi:hypothetical protein
MAKKLTGIHPLTDIKSYNNNMTLALKAKEDIHVFEEKPRMAEGQEEGQRKDAHELFSLFTANVLKERTVFIR